MLHLDPKVKGKYIKLGNLGWVKLDNIEKASHGNDGQGKHLVIKIKGKPDGKYRGNQVDYVKQVLYREGKG